MKSAFQTIELAKSFFKSPHWKHAVVGYAKYTPIVASKLNASIQNSTQDQLFFFVIQKKTSRHNRLRGAMD